MPTVFSHAIAALSVGAVILPKAATRRVWASGVICAMAPDLDVIAFSLGVPYASMLGHRGLSHSLLFALALSTTALVLLLKTQQHGLRLRVWLFLFVATVSHGMLDACTNGGLGIAFFAPLSNARLFFPFTPIEVSPIGRAFFSEWGLSVLRSEFLWVWLPSLTIIGISCYVRHIAQPR